MKKALALLLVLCMVIGLVACGGGKTEDPKTEDPKSDTNPTKDEGGKEPAKEAAGKDTLNVAFTQDRGTLDPCYNIGYDSLNAIRMFYEGLWEWNSKGEQEWILATGIDYVSDTCWHVKIREGIKFADGSDLTADDVMFSIEKANHRTGEPDYLPMLESMNVIDKYTVELNFSQYDLSYIYSMTSLMIFDKESYNEEEIAQHPNGTGPYKLDEYVVNSHISMSLRDGYWGETPKIKKMNFRIYTEEAQMTNAIVTGEVDVCNVPLQDIEYVKNSGKFNVDVVPTAQAQTRALYFNATEYGQLYNNPKGRTAIAMAIDTEAIVDLAYNGYGKVSVMPCSSYCIDANEEDFGYGVYGTGYDPEGAKALAEEAGILGKTFSISTNGSADAIMVAELIQTDLEAIGIHTNINNYDPGSWLSVAFSPADAGDMFVDFTGVPSSTVSQNISCWYLYHLGGGFTTCPFDNKERLDEISAVIMSIADPEARKSMNSEMVKIQTDAMLWYSLCDRVQSAGYATGLEGYERMIMGNVNYAKLYWAE